MNNRILFTILALALAVTQPVLAQPYLALGANLSSVYDSDLPLEQRFNSNPVFTLGNQFSEKSKVKASAELQYSIKGFKIKGAYIADGTFIPQGNSNLRIHYLDLVPTLELPLIGYANIVLGANAAMKLFDTYNDIQLESFKMKPHKTFDYGFVVGAKINYKQYWIRAILNKGLTNISQSPTSDHYKNVNVQIVIGSLLSGSGKNQ